jgi:TolA-binding protein
MILNFRLQIACLLCAGALIASADEFGVDQIKVQAAIDDELHQEARDQADALLRNATNDQQRAEAAVLLGQTLFHLKEFDSLHTLAKKMLNKHSDRTGLEGLAYWDARAWFEEQKFDTALKTLEPFTLPLNQSKWAAQSFRLRSFCYMTQHQWENAEITFTAFRNQFPDHPDAKRNLLDLASLYKQLDRQAEAQPIWEELVTKHPDTSEAREAALSLAESLILSDAAKNSDRITELLTPIAETNSDFTFRARQQRAALAEKLGKPTDAIAELTKALELTPDPDIKIETSIAIARLHMQAQQTDEAIAVLDQCISQAPNEALAARALLEKAKIQLSLKSYAEAEKSFQAYLAVADEPAGKAEAESGKAWSLWFQKRYAEAATTFEKAARLATDTHTKIETRLKAGDCFYIEEKYDQALSAYNAAAVTDPQHPLAPQASFLAGLSLVQLDQIDVALPHFQMLQKLYPDSPYAQQAAVEEGRIYDRQAKWDQALAIYAAVREKTSDSELKARAMLRSAMIHYRLNQFELANALFEEILNLFPESQRAEQAFYMRGFCLLQLDKPTQALAICREFIEKYPKSQWATDVTFWAGEYHYNHADYKKAEESFASIAAGYPDHAMADDALYWAGRSASAQEQFTTALEYYSALIKTYPSSPRLKEARFAQGEVLSELGDFTRAILAFDEVIKNYPGSPLADLAWGRKGDCHFTLGANEPDRYKEARAAYQILLQSAGSSPALRLQAQYKIGRCEEKMKRPTEAVSHYTALIYSYLNHEAEPTPENILWFTRAAFSAGTVKEETEQWREAVNIYQRVIEAKIPAADEAQNRIDAIKKKYFYLF